MRCYDHWQVILWRLDAGMNTPRRHAANQVSLAEGRVLCDDHCGEVSLGYIGIIG